jgi:hypothetical protein
MQSTGNRSFAPVRKQKSLADGKAFYLGELLLG